MSDERRKANRVKVDLRVDETTDGALYFQHASNLSLTGVFLDHTLPHDPGTRVNLLLHLPDDPEPLTVLGIVAGIERDVGMGIRFLEISQDDLRRLERYLTRKSMPPPVE